MRFQLFIRLFLRSLAAMHLDYSELKSNSRRADERTRTAFPLITSDAACVAGVCRRLQIPLI
jgi:hypothetical protein